MSRCQRLLPALALAVFLAVPSHAQDAASPERTVRVSGEATVTAVPDQATVRFGIVTTARTAEQARAQNASAAKTAMNAVRTLDVPDENMRMETLRLQPRREYDPETKQYEEKGYKATRQVVVELGALEQLPRLVATVVQGGANRLEGIQYELSDRTAVRNDALRQAATNAGEKADLLATTLGATLGPVRQITEETVGVDRPQPRVQMAKTAGAEAAPEPDAYAAGSIEVKARVQVVFELVAE